MQKISYTKFVKSSNIVGSNKADSYIKAIDWLCKILEVVPFSFEDCTDIWSVNSPKRIHELYEFVLQESKKGNSSLWNIKGIPPSYLFKGYCSAALKSYEAFLIEKNIEKDMFKVFDSYEGDELELPIKLEVPLDYPEYLIEGLENKQGEDVVRSVRTRINQNVFRKIILSIYKHSCCITGLNIPEINRASHIIPWAEDEEKRLDPSNGLCLSGTYDVAFDRNLISLDDDYRLIVSKKIREYSENESVKECFIKKEGMKIKLPDKFKPNKNYLAVHRAKGEY